MTQRLDRLFETARTQWSQVRKSRLGQWLLRGLRWGALAGILAYLTYQFTSVGWARVWSALPTTPWFYVLLLLMYATLPATEMVLYGTAWNGSPWALLPALLRKRVLNNDVAGYSGEAYFSAWAYRHTNLGSREILATIKDSTLLSSVASTSVAFLLLAVFFATEQVDVLTQFLPGPSSTLAAGASVFVLAVVLGVRFRHALFSLPPSLLWLIGTGHVVRFLLNNGLQVTQWAVVLPSVPPETWITLLALHIVINQVPLVPSRGLVFMSAGVGLSGPLHIPEAALASMLLAQTLLDRGLNLFTYAGTAALDAATAGERAALEDLSLPDEAA